MHPPSQLLGGSKDSCLRQCYNPWRRRSVAATAHLEHHHRLLVDVWLPWDGEVQSRWRQLLVTLLLQCLQLILNLQSQLQ